MAFGGGGGGGGDQKANPFGYAAGLQGRINSAAKAFKTSPENIQNFLLKQRPSYKQAKFDFNNKYHVDEMRYDSAGRGNPTFTQDMNAVYKDTDQSNLDFLDKLLATNEFSDNGKGMVGTFGQGGMLDTRGVSKGAPPMTPANDNAPKGPRPVLQPQASAPVQQQQEYTPFQLNVRRMLGLDRHLV